MIPAAADEVSAGVAHLFSRYAQGYQALAGQAAVFHEQFVQHLTAGAGSYAATEAANASLLQPLNAAAGTSPITVLAELLSSITSTAPGLLMGFLDSLATATPEQLLETALVLPLVILTFPIWFPVAVVGELGLILWANSLFPPGSLI